MERPPRLRRSCRDRKETGIGSAMPSGRRRTLPPPFPARARASSRRFWTWARDSSAASPRPGSDALFISSSASRWASAGRCSGSASRPAPASPGGSAAPRGRPRHCRSASAEVAHVRGQDRQVLVRQEAVMPRTTLDKCRSSRFGQHAEVGLTGLGMPAHFVEQERPPEPQFHVRGNSRGPAGRPRTPAGGGLPHLGVNQQAKAARRVRLFRGWTGRCCVAGNLLRRRADSRGRASCPG